jgi:hypothetical protein
MKVTEWFEPTVKPVHPGVYELEDLPYPFLYWDGEAWYGAMLRPEHWPVTGGVRVEFGKGYQATCRWRGLADKP